MDALAETVQGGCCKRGTGADRRTLDAELTEPCVQRPAALARPRVRMRTAWSRPATAVRAPGPSRPIQLGQLADHSEAVWDMEAVNCLSAVQAAAS